MTSNYLINKNRHKIKQIERRRYTCFVLIGVGQSSPWGKLKDQVLRGGESFVENPVQELKSVAGVMGKTWMQRLRHRPSAKKVSGNTKSRRERNLAMAKAPIEYGYK